MQSILSFASYSAAAVRLALSGFAAVAAVAVQPALAAEDAVIVYTETNALAGNQLLVFVQREDGALVLEQAVSTRGLGSGGGLSNQGALAVSSNGSLLFAINAGSDTISTFWIGDGKVEFVSAASSGGTRPVSIAIHGKLLYVLNQGSDSITGFRIHRDGGLEPLAGSTQALSAKGVVGAQVSFSAGAEFLVVTEKIGGKIGVFPVRDGIAQAGEFFQSNGAVPFGFALDRLDRLLVSEAAAGALTSYELDTDTGGLTVISGSVPTHQVAACWVAETPNGRFAFVTNTGSGSVSAFSIDRAGELSDLGFTLIAAAAGPTDDAVSSDGRQLFVLDDGITKINALRIGADGSLTVLPAMAPASLLSAATGLIVR